MLELQSQPPCLAYVVLRMEARSSCITDKRSAFENSTFSYHESLNIYSTLSNAPFSPQQLPDRTVCTSMLYCPSTLSLIACSSHPTICVSPKDNDYVSRLLNPTKLHYGLVTGMVCMCSASLIPGPWHTVLWVGLGLLCIQMLNSISQDSVAPRQVNSHLSQLLLCKPCSPI